MTPGGDSGDTGGGEDLGQVGRYRLLGFLGAGAMGEVFLAEDPHIERKLAIKTVRLLGRPAEVEDRKKRLLREARAAGRLLHPHIVTLFDAGEADGKLFLAFEFVEGTDLAGRLEAGPPLTLREALAIVRQTAQALDCAHQQGIIHRDIKPSNILLDTLGRVKVADFGIAKMAGQSTELTVTGSVMGSPQYLSPEQIRGDDLDGRSDLFSLGVLLYELLSGRRPFDGDTITTLVYQILHKEPPPLPELRAVPPRLEQLLHGLLAKDRADRIATAGLVAEEAAAIERELGDTALSAPAVMTATHVLPRTGAPAVPPPPPIPPIPTHRSTAAPPAPPPPPSLPTSPSSMPVRPATGRSVVGTEGVSPKVWLPVAAAVLVVAAVAVGWLAFRGGGGGGGKPEPNGTVATVPAPETPAPVAPSPEPFPRVTPTPVSPMPVSPTPVLPTPTPRETPNDRNVDPVKPPVPIPTPTPQPQRPPPVVIREETPAPVEPEETSRPVPPSPVADRTLRTGLALSFQVTPPDAFILVDRTVVGRAKEFSTGKGGHPFVLSGPGEHLIVIRKEGMRDFRIAVQAGETGGVTPVYAQLSALPAAQMEAGDLPVVRVSEAIAFRVRPPGAIVLVDDQVAGPALSYGGGLRGGSWLKLPPGRHRVSLTARGHLRYDMIVEVFPGAPKARERIDVNLFTGEGE